MFKTLVINGGWCCSSVELRQKELIMDVRGLLIGCWRLWSESGGHRLLLQAKHSGRSDTITKNNTIKDYQKILSIVLLMLVFYTS